MKHQLRKQSIRELGASPRQVNAYDKFMSGWDTLQIADIYSVNEPTVLRWVSIERSRRHEIASPYEAQHSNRILVVQGVRGVMS